MFPKASARAVLAALAASMILTTTLPAAAHHGWGWTTGKNITISGTVVEAKLGMPHGTLKFDVEGVIWQVEVGQPYRNESAGLKDEDFKAGAKLRIEGEPSADPKEKRLKAERIFIGDKMHNLYPDRQ